MNKKSAHIFPVLVCLVLSLAADGAEKSWNDIQSWVYQLCNYKDNKLDEIANARFDLAVIDLTRDGKSDYFKREEIEAVRKYINAIDGLGMESVFYMAHDKPADKRWCKENRDNALAIKKAGKLILGVDYARKPASIAGAYKQ